MTNRAYGLRQRRDATYLFSASYVWIAVLLTAMLSSPAAATHFRYGHITWVPRTDIGPRTVEFTVQNVWRRTAFTSGSDRCIDVATLTRKNCTGPGGAAGIGDVIHERQGGTRFDFGDGSPLLGVSIAGTDALLYLVTSIDPVNDWLFGFALDPTSLPEIDTTIEHTYSSSDTFTAKIEDCCRISPCTSPIAHLNNPDNGYRVATQVEIGGATPNSSPVSSLPPIVLCQQNAPCAFTVPVSDNELDAVNFRLSSSSEADFDFFDGANATQPGLGQPGPPACPNAAAIGGGSGQYTWNTSGCRLAASPMPFPPGGGCGNGSLSSMYSSQVTIEETGRQGSVAVDFLVQLLPLCPVFNGGGPVFHAPTPVCGSTLSVNPGGTLQFAVSAGDSDVNDTVTLNATGLPAFATMTPQLPTTANPSSSTFSWTAPTDFGQHVITFTATDLCGVQTICAITIDVSQEICGDGNDNDGDLLVDCADPDCNGTSCNDGQLCTTNDHCQGGVCAGSALDCSDHNACNGVETCSPTLGCQAGTPLTCPEDNNVCNGIATCDPTNGCVTGTALSCDDGNACNGVETCDAINGCQPGAPLNCDDGNACNGTETCDTQTGCVPGSPLNCDDGNACNGVEACDPQNGCAAPTSTSCDDSNICTLDTCQPPTGCVHDAAARNGFVCNDGDVCTVGDVCSAGACVGSATGDTDGDGYCDTREVQAGCNPNLAAEIPPQAAKYDGGGGGPANVLVTFVAPTTRNIAVASDPSCKTAGTCGPQHFCTAGKIANPCSTDTDCNQAANTCRVVVNWANVPDLAFDPKGGVRLNRTTITPSFAPVTAGCTLKVDVQLNTSLGRNALKLRRLSGTVGGRRKRDTDAFIYRLQ